MNRAVRGIVAVVVGTIAGFAFAILGIVIFHGPCRVPLLRDLWCHPAPFGTPGQPDIFDLLGVPVAMAIGIGIFWRVWVQGKSWSD